MSAPMESDESQLQPNRVMMSSSEKERIEFVFHNKLFSDVCFVVGEEEKQKIYANKVILYVASSVFQTMFSERWEGNGEIEVPDVLPAAFVELLRFIYCKGAILTMDIVWSVLYAAKKYDIEALKDVCLDFFKETIDSTNVLNILMDAKSHNEDKVMELCLEMIDNNKSVIESQDFLTIDIEALCLILKRDTLKRIFEINLFQVLLRWTEAECSRQRLPITPANKQSVAKMAVSLIRFPLMSLKNFVEEVPESGLLSTEEQLSILLYFTRDPKPATNYNTRPRDWFENSMKIFIQPWNGTKFHIFAFPFDTIRTVKQLIEEVIRIPPDVQRLIFAGHELNINDTIETVSRRGTVNRSTFLLATRFRA